jgi:hypothetical protein
MQKVISQEKSLISKLEIQKSEIGKRGESGAESS